MELRNLKTFLHVAEQCSFSKAAALLGYSQSTVTAQIQQLEIELETRLFDRIHKTVRLTVPGHEFLVYAQHILKTAEEAKTAMKRLPLESGELRIAMGDSLCSAFFPSILESYHKAYPQVQLRLLTAGTDEMFRMIRHNEADLVYTLDRRIYSSDLVTAFEKEEEICFASSPDYLNNDVSLTMDRLPTLELLLTERNMSYRSYLEEILAAHTIEIHPFLELGNTDILRGLAEKGMGLTFLPYYTIRESLKSGQLIRHKIEGCSVSIWRQLIYHKSKWVTPAMQALIHLIHNQETDKANDILPVD